MTTAELNEVIKGLRANSHPDEGVSDAAFAAQRHEFLDIDTDLADRDYSATPARKETQA
jgi:hypothetical protein